MACSCVCFRSEQAMWRLTFSVRNKTVMTRALKTTIGLPSCQKFAVSSCWRHALAVIRFVWLLYWFVFWNFNMVARLFHRLEDVLDSYDSSAKDDSRLPSCQQFAVSTCWRHALAVIRFVWLPNWFVFWNFNMVALWFHRLEDVLDKTR